MSSGAKRFTVINAFEEAGEITDDEAYAPDGRTGREKRGPERVKKVCETDRSIAIAHDLEHLCKIEPPKAKKSRKAKGKKTGDDADSEVVEMEEES